MQIDDTTPETDSILVATDIFGRTPWIEQWCKTLPLEPVLIDPYDGEDMAFTSEPHAYETFMEKTGVDRYTQLIGNRLKKTVGRIFIIAFSVGATSVWRLSAHRELSHIKKAACFYSSQIRYYLNINPRFDIELIFPEKEPRFNVDRTIAALNTRHRVKCFKAEGLHGFMNRHSTHFDPSLVRICTDHLIRLINGQKSSDPDPALKNK